MNRMFTFILIFILGCSSFEKNPNPLDLDIHEVEPNKHSALTKQNLMHLTRVYDLEPLLFTKKIQIHTGVMNKSHPVLTLNTKYSEEPKKTLSVLLHEELHWWAMKNVEKFNLAIQDLKKIYPKAPGQKVGGPNTTYLHLIICYLEMKALSFYLGKKEARKIISSFMQKDKRFQWAYYQILHKDYAIKQVIEKRDLHPQILR